MGQWQSKRLEEICEMKYGKMPRKEDLVEEGYPVFSGYGIVGRHKRYLYTTPEIAVVARGIGGCGDIKMTPPHSFVTNIAIVLKLISPEVHKKFLFYRLTSTTLRSLNTGSAQPQIIIADLKNYVVEVPPLPTQHKIASILSTYDELIENNTRRIKILEEMAQSIYREWFVNFRYPEHEKFKMVDSPLGMIPEGWEFQRLDKLCSSVLDGDWIETKDQGGEAYRLLQISNIGLGDFVETGKFRYVTQETFDRLRCTEIQPDDLLIARMPTPIGRGWLVRKMPWRMITAVDVAIARPDRRRISPVFLLYFWNQPSTLAAIEKQSSGTTRLRITRRQLCDMLIPTPSHYIQEEFSAKTGPMLDLPNILRDKNTTLRKTRDLLLPRLISGEIDVTDLDIQVPEELSQ